MNKPSLTATAAIALVAAAVLAWPRFIKALLAIRQGAEASALVASLAIGYAIWVLFVAAVVWALLSAPPRWHWGVVATFALAVACAVPVTGMFVQLIPVFVVESLCTALSVCKETDFSRALANTLAVEATNHPLPQLLAITPILLLAALAVRPLARKARIPSRDAA